MAVKRATNPIALVRRRAAFLARVRRTANKVTLGRLDIEDVVPELREFVRESVERRRQPAGPPNGA